MWAVRFISRNGCTHECPVAIVKDPFDPVAGTLTLIDDAVAGLYDELVEQAVMEAIDRGLVWPDAVLRTAARRDVCVREQTERTVSKEGRSCSKRLALFSASRATMGIEPWVILEIYDAMQQAIASGQPYQAWLDPPPERVEAPPTIHECQRRLLSA